MLIVRHKGLLVVVMLLSLHNKHGYTIIINVIDNAVLGRYVARIGYVVSTNKSFGMAQSCTWMLHNVHQNLRCFLEEFWVRLFPFAQCLIGLL